MTVQQPIWGVWRLSSRVLDFRSKGCGFETRLKHWVVSLSKTLFPLFSTGLTHENKKSSKHD